MKLFICLLALSLVSASICVPVDKDSSRTKRGAGYGSSYSSYSSAPVMVERVVAPAPVQVPAPVIRTQVVQLEAAPTYSAPAPTYSAPAPTILRENTVVTETVRPLEPEYQRLCLDKKGYASVFYLPHPTRQSWYIQCDEFGQGYLKECPAGTIFTLNLVCENINDLHPVEEKRTIVQPQMDTVVGSYNTAPVFAADTTTSIEATRVEVIHEAPEFQELCLSKRSRSDYGSAATVFYLPHPNKQSWYIQCDEHGRAFIKDCPAGTVFTLNLVCEKIGELHAVEQQTVVQPQLDNVHTSSYGSAPVATTYSSSSYTSAPVAPVVSLDAPTYTETVIPENPEFRELCLSKRSAGVAVFYLQHPQRQTSYIQCDEFGRSFVKDCPANTIFTLNLVCEKIDDLHPIEEKRTLTTQLDTVVGSYNTAPVFANDNTLVQNTVTVIEAPEFKQLCSSKRDSGVAVFYLPHPSRQSWYIQCDEFGKAFVKECPANTIFTLNLVCEKIDDLHPIEQTQTVVKQQLDVPVTGAYNSAPVFPLESSAVVETARVEVIQEAPEFRELCLSKRTSGVAIFYLPHPNKQSWYIQCDEFGRAFMKECPANTIFTSRLTCEKIGEIHEFETVVERPVVREQIISQPVLAYGERHIERPVMQEVQTTYSAPAPVAAPAPILREVQSTYAAPAPVAAPAPILREVQSTYSAPAPILREQIITPVAPRPIMREVQTSYSAPAPVLREVHTSSYAAPAPRPILREQVIRPVVAPRPIMREVHTSYAAAPVAPRPIMREVHTSSYAAPAPRPIFREVVAPRSSY
jgi:acid stress-induced BolA-like protein IbaG/YrbA